MFIAYNSIVRCTFTETQNKFHVNDNIYNKINIWTKNNIFTYCTYIDIQKFNIKYLVMYKVQMHTGAIS